VVVILYLLLLPNAALVYSTGSEEIMPLVVQSSNGIMTMGKIRCIKKRIQYTW